MDGEKFAGSHDGDSPAKIIHAPDGRSIVEGVCLVGWLITSTSKARRANWSKLRVPGTFPGAAKVW